MNRHKIFVTGHKGFETLLHHELRAILGPSSARVEKRYGGIEIQGDLEAAYRICLYSRLANRVFLELARFKAVDEKMLYEQVYRLDWSEHLRASNTLAVSANVSRSALDHDHFVALKVKDAVVDQFRAASGQRPSIAKQRPDLQLHLQLHQNNAQLSLDLSGESLHRRGYRLTHSGAPLKEHLAAAMLMQAGWQSNDDAYGRLLDPMCGSGTFAIEAALIAADRAPGLLRDYFGFSQWRGHRPDLWQSCLEEAEQKVIKPAEVCIFASDYDTDAVSIARENANRAGVSEWIEFKHRRVEECILPDCQQKTLIVANPPYGKRLHSDQDLGDLYSDLGQCVGRLAPARLAIISANPESMHRLQLPRSLRKAVRNGPLECVFALYDTDAATVQAQENQQTTRPSKQEDNESLPLRNRLQKNFKHLQRWAKRNQVSCYRIYDADLPEFSFALDRYESELDPAIVWFHLQEYKAPASIDPDKAARRLELAQHTVQDLFSVPQERLFCKTRSRQRGSGQYQKLDRQGELFQVREGEASILVNLSDYLDTGLFLDHRITRARLFDAARGKSVLNLFCYTAVAGLQAALGGAESVINVDMSQSYLKWAAENLKLNNLDDESRYRLVRADVLALLEDPAAFAIPFEYDLIFLDPPSFSNSTRMHQTLDIQRDHAQLIDSSMRLLLEDGLLVFSCNRRGFKLAEDLTSRYDVSDISRLTIPEDFKRNSGIHGCWEIRHRDKN